jgi:hypothetical protein
MTVATATFSAPAAPPQLPTSTALALERASWNELETAFLRGATPDVDALVGWEFRGINRFPFNGIVPIAEVTKIKKFVKGFLRTEDGAIVGYNRKVKPNALDGRWDIADRRFGFFAVNPVDATARDNRYLHALLLDYGKGGNPRGDLSSGVRDYLVQLGPDMFLGKAYYALGPLRLRSNFFILERHRVGLTDYARR